MVQRQQTIYTHVIDVTREKHTNFDTILRMSWPLTLTDILFSPTALKKEFAKNEEIQEMAQDGFIMLNLMVHELYSVF